MTTAGHALADILTRRFGRHLGAMIAPLDAAEILDDLADAGYTVIEYPTQPTPTPPTTPPGDVTITITLPPDTPAIDTIIDAITTATNPQG